MAIKQITKSDYVFNADYDGGVQLSAKIVQGQGNEGKYFLVNAADIDWNAVELKNLKDKDGNAVVITNTGDLLAVIDKGFSDITGDLADLGTAAGKDFLAAEKIGAGETPGNDLVSEKQVVEYVTLQVADLAGAMHFVGVVGEGETADDLYGEDEEAKAGDVYVNSKTAKEYVYDGSAWVELGDEGAWDTKGAAATVKEELLGTADDEAGAATIAGANKAAAAAQADADALEEALGEGFDKDNTVADAIAAAAGAVTVTETSVSKGDVTFNKYVHPTFTETDAAAVKVGMNEEGHVVLGDALAASDIAATAIEAGDDTVAVEGDTVAEQIASLGEAVKAAADAASAAHTQVNEKTDGHVTVSVDDSGDAPVVTVEENDIASAALLGTADDAATANTAFGKAAEAKAAADAAQDDVDALEELVGELPEDATAETIVDYIDEKVGAITHPTKEETEAGSGNISVKYSQSEGEVSITASLSEATVTDGVVADADAAKLVKASDVVAIAEKAANDATTIDEHSENGDDAGVAVTVKTTNAEVSSVEVAVTAASVTYTAKSETEAANLEADDESAVLDGSAISEIKSYVDAKASEVSSENFDVDSVQIKKGHMDEGAFVEGSAETDKTTLLIYSGEKLLGYADATQFVKDGMISEIDWKEDADSTLVVTFNTDAGKEAIEVDMSKFIDTYTSGDEKRLSVNEYVITPLMATVEDGAIKEGDEEKLVDAASAKAIADKEIEDKVGKPGAELYKYVAANEDEFPEEGYGVLEESFDDMTGVTEKVQEIRNTGLSTDYGEYMLFSYEVSGVAGESYWKKADTVRSESTGLFKDVDDLKNQLSETELSVMEGSEDYVEVDGLEVGVKTKALGDAVGMTKDADGWHAADGSVTTDGLASAADVAAELVADEEVIAAALNAHEERLDSLEAVELDAALSETSTNGVQNKVIYEALCWVEY